MPGMWHGQTRWFQHVWRLTYAVVKHVDFSMYGYAPIRKATVIWGPSIYSVMLRPQPSFFQMCFLRQWAVAHEN
jgi:hypothetical protein